MEFLVSRGQSAENVFRDFREYGGFCDCEVI